MKDTANGSSHTRSKTLNQQSGAVQSRAEERKEKMAKMKKETDEGDKEKKRIMRGRK